MSSLIEKIHEITQKNQPNRHTFFQLKHFVIGKEPTIQAKIHKCQTELDSRSNTIEGIQLQLEQNYDDLILLEKEEKEEKDEFKTRKLKRKQKYLKNQIITLRNKMIATEQECHFIIEMYEHLISIEQPKDWDDFAVQEEYWEAKLTMELNAKIMLGQPVSTDVVQTVMALPDKTPIKQKLIQLITLPKAKSVQNLNA